MFTGGEPVPYLRALDFEHRTGATVLQFYGSNETGLITGTSLADDADRRLHTAGKIAAEMEVRLFEDGVDVTSTGRGQPGCRGPALSSGYLDDDAANRLLFAGVGPRSQRWMLMADVCTVDADGYMSVVGRTSDIIIRGGKNISAPQVESEVATHPAIAHAAAVAAPDPGFGERVAVYVQLLVRRQGRQGRPPRRRQTPRRSGHDLTQRVVADTDSSYFARFPTGGHAHGPGLFGQLWFTGSYRGPAAWSYLKERLCIDG